MVTLFQRRMMFSGCKGPLRRWGDSLCGGNTWARLGNSGLIESLAYVRRNDIT